ncbi:MAG: class III extradiol dioxygenase subunit B-like domain-containing protein [Nocardioidaceae bacterium]
MLVAASVCPSPPLLVPAVSVGAAAERADLRAACLAAVRRLVTSGVDQIMVVGTGEPAGDWDASAGGNLCRFGVDAGFGGERQVLPLPLTLGAYLLDEAAWRGERRYVAVESNTEPAALARAGAGLVLGDRRLAMLVMGDGSAKRAVASPGYLDARAEAFDAAVVVALTRPDPEALLDLDPNLCEELWAAGRPAWQVLAGAAKASAAPPYEGSIRTTLGYDAAPYGVGYWVVDWAIGRAA